jgi:hypothetical protein
MPGFFFEGCIAMDPRLSSFESLRSVALIVSVDCGTMCDAGR